MITADSPWRHLGTLSVETWREEFTAHDSPMVDEVAACHKATGRHSALALVQAWVEDQYATTGSKPRAKNPLNLRPGPGRMEPTVTVPSKGEFLVFESYPECFKEWRRRLFDEAATYKGGVYAKAGPTIFDLIADAYCPKGLPGTPEFHNDPAAYTRSLVRELKRLGATPVDGEDEPGSGEIVLGRVPRPAIVDMAIGDKIDANGNTVGYDLLGMRKGLLVGTCLHRMHGSLSSTFNHFSLVHVGALTDYGVGGSLDGDRDGQIWHYNDPEGGRTPWASGFNPNAGEGPGNDPDGMAFKAKFPNESHLTPWNRRLVSIECSGFLPDATHSESDLTPAQIESIAHLVAYWHDRIGVPWDVFPNHPKLGVRTLLFHDSFSTKKCPGNKLHAKEREIVDKARAIMRRHQGSGASKTSIVDPTKIVGIDADLLKRWFGHVKAEDGKAARFSRNGKVSKLWGAAGADTGQFPAITEVQVFKDNPRQTRRYYRFAGGLTIFQTTGKPPRIVRGGDNAMPPGMDLGLAKRWFGRAKAEDGTTVRFDRQDEVCNRWLEYGAATGQYPQLSEVQIFKDSPTQTRRYYRFDGGLTIFETTGQKAKAVKGDDGAFPPGMDSGLAKRWFGRSTSENGQGLQFDPDERVCKLWVATGAKSGQFPAIADIQVFKDSPQQTRRYTRFDDGLTIFQTTGQKARVLRA